MDTETLVLPTPTKESNISLEETIAKRRSTRRFSQESISIDEVAQLLWSGQGINTIDQLRTAPSAGALYPLELYISSGRVDSLEPGVYKYFPMQHTLEKRKASDQSKNLCSAALGQSCINDSAITIAISAVYERVTRKYSKRGIQYVHMEAGHVAQNILLQSVSLGLGAVVIGAFNDDSVHTILNMNQVEDPLYLIPIGKT